MRVVETAFSNKSEYIDKLIQRSLFTICFLLLLAQQVYISEVEVHLSLQYAQETVDSCRQVSVPSTGEYALDLMCDNTMAAQCTPQKFYDFIGNNPVSPFKIDFILHSPNDGSPFIPPEMPTIPCSQAAPVSLESIS